MTRHIGRLALRVRGEHWVAYCAKPDTMDGAIWLGAITIKAVTDNPLRRQVFMDLMRGVCEECLSDDPQIVAGGSPAPTLSGSWFTALQGPAAPGVAGVSLRWLDPPRPAPQHERSGK